MRTYTKTNTDGSKATISYIDYSDIGIYRITCLANNRTYVGQSRNVPVRMRSHKAALRNQKYLNKGKLCEMQSDYNLHGIDMFIFEQIDECDEEFLLEYETQWCIHYANSGYDLYNTFINTKQTGIQCPDEFKSKLSWLNLSEANLTDYINASKAQQAFLKEALSFTLRAENYSEQKKAEEI